MNDLLLIIVLLFLFIVTFIASLGILFWFSKNRVVNVLKKDQLLTEGELKFLNKLTAILTERFLVFPQLKLSTIVHPQTTSFLDNILNPLESERLDFVVFDNISGEIILAIELDGEDQDRGDRKNQDQIIEETLKKISLPLLHLKYNHDYSNDELILLISEALVHKETPPAQTPQDPPSSTSENQGV